jgi:serine/threonine-protein kinase
VSQAALRTGDVIGRYRLGPALGAGGAGSVFRTEGPDGAPCAIKVMRGDASTWARARREVEALARLDHPNVLGLVDWGHDEGQAWLVTQLVPGLTFREVLAGGPMLPETATLLVGFAAAGVGAIHGAGLVHRDLKPDNLMLTDDGRVVVIDLGLALAPDWTRQTVEGTIAGSLPYMAPEQIEGEAVPASDVWALCVTLWELIAGTRPFARGRAQEEVGAILGGVRPRFAEVDRRIGGELAALVERGLAHDAAGRPESGAALAAELSALVAPALGGEAPVRAVQRIRADRGGWEAQLRPRAARRAAADALALADGGDPFAAMRAIDRAMAYDASDPAVTSALGRVMPRVQAAGSDPGALATAVTGPSPGVRRARRWPWIVLAVALVGGAGTTAALLQQKGAGGPPLDRTDPESVVESIIWAARTGKTDHLPSLCLPGVGDGDVREVCAVTTDSPKWPSFVDFFSSAEVIGAMRGPGGARVGIRLGPMAGRDEETIELVERGGQYYLESF